MGWMAKNQVRPRSSMNHATTVFSTRTASGAGDAALWR